MMVSELIEKLKAMPSDAIVVVRGYEDGVNEADSVIECNIKPNELGNEWYYGLYEISPDNGEKAVFINSTRDGMRGDND